MVSERGPTNGSGPPSLRDQGQFLSLLEPGRVVGRFEVLEVVGEGGMAVVYKVRHQALHSIHALKILDPTLARDEGLRNRFLTEGRIQAGLKHPNIVAVTDVVVEEGVAGLVAEFVEGLDLHDWIESNGPTIDLATIKGVFLPLLDALGHAHAQGVVHRDVKPSNIILATSPDGSILPKLLDFGIAKVLSGGGARHATRTGARMGTMAYMSPEQVRGAADLDSRTDIFAVAATLQEFLTGDVPFDGDSDFETMRQIVEGDPAELPAGIDPRIRECVVRGLQKNREDRFESCADFAKHLSGAGIRKPRSPSPSPVRPPKPAIEEDSFPNAPGVMMVGCFGVAAIAVALLVGLQLFRTPGAEPPPNIAEPAPFLTSPPDLAVPKRSKRDSRPLASDPTPRPVASARESPVPASPRQAEPSPTPAVEATTPEKVSGPGLVGKPKGDSRGEVFAVRLDGNPDAVFAGDEVVVRVIVDTPSASPCSVIVTWWDQNDDPRIARASPDGAAAPNPTEQAFAARWIAKSMVAPETRYRAKATCGDRSRRSAQGTIQFIP